ncbi:hypothetical protein [Mesorhizobium sp. M0500]|uniref:hypothetical protein n=1 Tax=unclassified Mesorhizobium TaxID=325217 RepID=UPI00333C85D7
MLARQIGGRRKTILGLPDADRPAGLRTYVSVDAAKFVAQSLDAQLQVDAAFAVKTDRTFCQFGARCLLTWSETPTDVRTAKSELAFAWSSSRAATC